MKKILFLFCFILPAALLFAQPKIIVKGVVSNEFNQGLTGAAIIEKETQRGVYTGFDGYFAIEVLEGATLVISFPGYRSKVIQVTTDSELTIQLTNDILVFEETVQAGYGSVSASNLVSSVPHIESESIIRNPSAFVMESMQGKVAGLQIVNDGAPGVSPVVRIRGIGTYPVNGNENPLFVVDGMLFDDISFLNPFDIASVTVLKDATASAIYGVKAANGVVYIKTKSGNFNQETRIVYNGYEGFQFVQNKLEMANAEQYVTMVMESESASEFNNIQNAMQRYGRSRINPDVPVVDTDWHNEILRLAPIQNHNFGFSGGSENVSFSFGTNYFDQQGILDTKNEFKRFNIRSKINYQATNWLTAGGNLILSSATQFGYDDLVWRNAYWAVPILPVFDEENTEAWPLNFASAQHLGYESGQNPVPALVYNKNRTKKRDILAGFFIHFDVIPQKLNYKSTFYQSSSSFDFNKYGQPYFISAGFQRPAAEAEKSAGTFSSQIWDNVITYTESFENHQVLLLGGTSYRKENQDILHADDFKLTEEISAENVFDDLYNREGLSFFGRISYNFDNRYLLYSTLRADGISKFEKKWGFFPAVGAGWIISGEDFFSGSSLLDYLKLYISRGKLGNDRIQENNNREFAVPTISAIHQGLFPGNINSNNFPSVKWEITKETNIGIVARMFNKRFTVNMDYYNRKTINAAIEVLNPSDDDVVIQNSGRIKNAGFELALEWKDWISNDFSYSASANFTKQKNTVQELGGQDFIDGGIRQFRQRTSVGNPLLAFYGYKIGGIYQNENAIRNDPVAVENNLEPGDFIYVDQNNDDMIDEEDRVVLGTYFPSFYYGANFELNFKNFGVSVTLMGQTGNKILNRKRGGFVFEQDLNMDADLVENRWYGEGTSDSYPSAKALNKEWNHKMSDFFVENGGFFRIQNIQLVYMIEKAQIFGSPVPDAKIMITAERPLTISGYSGFTPEVSNGIDRNTYPVPSVYSIGVDFSF